RSFVYPRLVAAGAEFVERGDCAVASRIPGTQDAPLQLVDLSPLMRTGIKGRRARRHLTDAGGSVPEANNTAVRAADGTLVLRLGDNELLLLSDPRGDDEAVHGLEAGIPGAGAWPVPRRDSHCWFLLRGAAATDCLAKLCGVDLRAAAFAPGAVAQTSVARLNAIVCRDPDDDTPAFHLLADSASALWFWDALLDAMAEFGGGPAGLDSLV
ncbi:MAG: hypothetical protein R3225_05405, partial [Halofilum sp. (in: g-proteobacteria)]|nr:hypothetical protein [Halofilum sp. (in: g-proteobacteria)]